MNNKIKHIFLGLLLSFLALPACSNNNKESYKEYNFKYWNDSSSLALLKDYVKDVTNEEGKNYIPKEQRIVTFNLDGTLYGERSPIFIEGEFFSEYYESLAYYFPRDPRLSTPIMYKNEYNGPDKIDENVLLYPSDVCRAVNEYRETRIAPKVYQNGIKDDKRYVTLDTAESYMYAQLFSTLTIKDYNNTVNTFLDFDAISFNNLLNRNMFYLPMIEIVEFLQLNNFDVYIVSGTDRLFLRELIKNHINIDPSKVIGSDVKLEVDWNTGDLIRTSEYLGKCSGDKKVESIVKEIGKRPVLSFGNSDNDIEMNNYTISKDNNYRSLAFMVIADDREREFGYTDKEIESTKQKWSSYNYQMFSMKNEWKTIYGDKVTIK